MKSATGTKLVLVTAPDLRTARRLASEALKARVIACANLVPRIESHYHWKGKIERSMEVLMVMKTRSRRIPALEKLVLREHPYDTPEILVLDLASGNERYLRWLKVETADF